MVVVWSGWDRLYISMNKWVNEQLKNPGNTSRKMLKATLPGRVPKRSDLDIRIGSRGHRSTLAL